MPNVIDCRRDFELMRGMNTPKGRWLRCQVRAVLEFFEDDTEAFSREVGAAVAACETRGEENPWDYIAELVARTTAFASGTDEQT